MNTVCSEPRYGEIKIARAKSVEASMRRSNMSQPTSNDSDQDDFNVISAQYKLCLEKKRQWTLGNPGSDTWEKKLHRKRNGGGMSCRPCWAACRLGDTWRTAQKLFWDHGK